MQYAPMRDPRLQEILERSASDPVFRQRLLTEPHRAVRETFGIEIPLSFRIRFIEKSPDDDALIVLPNAARPAAVPPAPAPDPPATPAARRDVSRPAAALEDGELDDAALETVAGGWGDESGTTRGTSAGGDWSQGDGWSDGDDWSAWTGWK